VVQICLALFAKSVSQAEPNMHPADETHQAEPNMHPADETHIESDETRNQ
jgi:hypothetical protein